MSVVRQDPATDDGDGRDDGRCEIAGMSTSCTVPDGLRKSMLARATYHDELAGMCRQLVNSLERAPDTPSDTRPYTPDVPRPAPATQCRNFRPP